MRGGDGTAARSLPQQLPRPHGAEAEKPQLPQRLYDAVLATAGKG